MNGWSFHMQYAMFKVLLKHNKKPKYVIQIADDLLFTDRKNFYNYTLFLPYSNDKIIRKATKHYKGSFTIPELYFPLFKYNNKMNKAWKGLKYYFSDKEQTPLVTYKGFWINDMPWGKTFDEYKKKHPDRYDSKIDSPLLKEFSEYLEFCSKNDIKVFIVWGPVYYERYHLLRNSQKFKQIFSSLSSKYNFPFLDYSEDSIGLSKMYFYDSYHLNKQGVEVFNPRLARDISELMK